MDNVEKILIKIEKEIKNVREDEILLGIFAIILEESAKRLRQECYYSNMQATGKALEMLFADIKN